MGAVIVWDWESSELANYPLSGFRDERVLFCEMILTDNAACWRNYLETGSEAAFAEVVGRHFDLVYSAALRLVAGDSHLAQDIAQSVFTDLARKARGLPTDVILGGWLYRHTCFTASKAVRSERRRQERERQSVEMNQPNDSSAALWRQLAPALEEAMGELSETDRNAVVLRFFERQPFRSVGEALGTTEDGARKRVDRALEKLRGIFGNRGVTVSAVLLAEVLHAQAVTMAPVGMAAGVAAASIAGATSGSSAGVTLIKLMAITKTQMVLTAAGIGLAAVFVVQLQTAHRLRGENLALLQRAELDAQSATNPRPAANLAKPAVAAGLSPDENSELLRLRGGLGGLRRQVTNETRLLTRERANRNAATSDPIADQVDAQQKAIERMGSAKNWMIAFLMFAEEHKGQFPTNFDEAMSFAPRTFNDPTNALASQFEIMYQGSRDAITNWSSTIVVREKEASQMPGKEGWFRAYGFADGHSELHRAADGNFEPWESKHMQPGPVGP